MLHVIRYILYHFRFPREPQKCQIWLAALGLSGWNPPKTATVCSNHFTDNDFCEWCRSKRILKETAVPSVSIHMSMCNNLIYG